MKKIYLAIAAFAFSQSLSAQTFTADEASKHVGETVTICGKIFGGRFFETSKNCPTLLNMGAPYPSSPITIMIPGDIRTKLGYAPETELKEKIICVHGEIILFKERPEIVVNDISQMEITK